MITACATPSLGDVAKVVRGITFKPADVISPQEDDAVVCMRTKNVQVDLDQESLIAVPSSFVHRDEQFLIEGDILVSSANSWELVGKSCWVPDLDYRAAAGGFISILRANRARVWPRYLYYWITAPGTQHALRHCGRQTTNISNLSFERAMSLEVPLPFADDPLRSITEQKRIAAILDKADAIRRKRNQYNDDCWAVINSTFHDLFGRHLTTFPVQFKPDERIAPPSWKWHLLNRAARLESGHTPSRSIPAYWDGGIPWISLTDIRALDGTIAHATSREVSPLGIEHSSSRILPSGTVCLARTASVGFVTTMGRDMATSQDFVNWVCGPDLIPEYLMWALIYSRQWITAIPDGSTHKTIYVPTVERFGIAMPPKPDQESFAAIYHDVISIGDRQRRAAQAADNLFNALVQRAFRGEL